MDRNGLIRRCISLANSAITAYDILHQTKEAANHRNTQQDLVAFLKDVNTFGELDMLFSIEKILITSDLENKANSQEEENSYKAALSQINSALDAVPLVLDGATYKKLALSFATKQKKNEIPQDAVCAFIQSHIVRINNRLASSLPVPEKNVLRQRKENMGKIRELYTDLQRHALGIAVPTQKNELSR